MLLIKIQAKKLGTGNFRKEPVLKIKMLHAASTSGLRCNTGLQCHSRVPVDRHRLCCTASTSVGSNVMLDVQDLKAKIVATGEDVLNGVALTIREGEVHAIMGKNGSGKSTLSKVLVGHPDYEVTSGSVTYKGQDLLVMEPEERSHAGMFMSFQSPIAIPGVSNVDFLRMACNARRKAQGITELDPLEFYGYVTPKVQKQWSSCTSFV